MIEEAVKLLGTIVGAALAISLKAFLFTYVAVKTLAWMGVTL